MGEIGQDGTEWDEIGQDTTERSEISSGTGLALEEQDRILNGMEPNLDLSCPCLTVKY